MGADGLGLAEPLRALWFVRRLDAGVFVPEGDGVFDVALSVWTKSGIHPHRAPG